MGEQRGSYASFDQDWRKALETRDPRWFSYPNPDASTQIEMFEYVKALKIASILDELNLKSGKVLEYGCGSAGIAIYLANRGFEVTAADISVKALDVARINASLHGSPQTFDVVCGDTFCLPFADKTFDMVMSYGLLEHFDAVTLPQALADINRVLKPGGLFLADIIPGTGRFSVRSISSIVNYCGSVAFHVLSGKFREIGKLYAAYFGHFYENSYGPQQWHDILTQSGLSSVVVQVCRPFPPLALKGRAERAYVNWMRRRLGFWLNFDSRNSPFTRRWGWMYLTYGLRRYE
jgi:ubiquinone/menaquinone biosynthesis C-methylase UbiE